jgi:hypothetical protein
MTENTIYLHENGLEIEAIASSSFQVMLDQTKFKVKPTKKQSAIISNRLVTAATTIEIEDLAKMVGDEGCSFIAGVLDGSGRSAVNWVEQQIFCLDFDNKILKITLEEFEQRCEAFRIQPAFVYRTFSYTVKNGKFRAVFVMDHIITDVRLRNLIVHVMMKIFPECDQSCKDASRIYFGGKGLVCSDFARKINPFQLFERCMKKLNSDGGSNAARSKKTFLKQVSLDLSHYELGVENLGYLSSKSEEFLDRPYIYRERSRKSSFSGIVNDGQVFTIHWKDHSEEILEKKKHLSRSSAIYSDVLTSSNIRLSESDINVLKEKCQLFREYRNGERRVPKLERRILLSNLRWYRNGISIYREGLNHFDDTTGCEDPYPMDDASLLKSANVYNFKPERCDNCPYHDTCQHGKNLLHHVRLRAKACRKVEDRSGEISLEESRVQVREALQQILGEELPRKDITILRADCGVGKTEALLDLLPGLDRICIAFPTHKLAQEAFSRFAGMAGLPDYFLWPDRPQLPELLKKQLEAADGAGMSRTREIYEAALLHEEVSLDPELTQSIQSYLDAYRAIYNQTRIFCTHEKAVRLIEGRHGGIDTYVFDEDPIKTLFKINQVNLTDVKAVIERLKNSDTPMPQVLNALKKVTTCEPNILMTPGPVKYPGKQMVDILGEVPISSPVGSLLDCTGYIKPEFRGLEDSDQVYSIQNRLLSENCKYLILSATPILPLYEKAYGERINLINTSPVKLKGKLHLHRDRSYSKSCIQSLKESFIETVENYVQEYDLDGITVFKEFSSKSDSGLVLKESKKQVPVFTTYGATEGVNLASGKDIGVIGTPRLPVHALKLMGHAVGIPVNQIPFEFAPRTVRRNEFEVSLWCQSDDEFFQALEFTLVERELAQAVGRARLPENDCEVHLFSNYVLSGGELWRNVG